MMIVVLCFASLTEEAFFIIALMRFFVDNAMIMMMQRLDY